MCAVKGIHKPGSNDVLCGRGRFAMIHPGNKFFHHLVTKHKLAYVLGDKKDKHGISKLIVDVIHGLNPSGIFLKEDPKTSLYYDVGYARSLAKTRQALREDAPELLKRLSNNSESDQSKDSKCSLQKTSTDFLLQDHSQLLIIPKKIIRTVRRNDAYISRVEK